MRSSLRCDLAILGQPCPVKSCGNSPGKPHCRYRFTIDIPAVENDKITGIRCLAVDTDEQPAIVFSRGSGTRHEHRFAVLVTFWNPISLHRTRSEIVAND